MPRIRSLHPGLFTDENYACLSFAARELLKGLWVEADDSGIFEWKPLTLKMRIFPADQVDVPDLLAELERAWVRRFEVGGKSFGACKNFCRYQRPKKPNSIHPVPEEIKPYVGHGYKARSTEAEGDEPTNVPDDPPTSTEPVPNQFPTGTEKSFQMEDGGGNKKKDKLAGRTADDGFEEWYRAFPRKEKRGEAERAYRAALKATDAATLLAGAQRYRQQRASEDAKFTRLPATWLNSKCWLDETPGEQRPAFELTDLSGWRARMQYFRDGKGWVSKWGPKPGEQGCIVPADLLVESDPARAAA